MNRMLEASSRTNKDIDWSASALLTLTVFLILQIAFVAKPAHVPDPTDIKHINGKLLRTSLIWNQDIFDSEMLIRSGGGDILIYAPSAGTIPESIKFIDKNALLAIDYYFLESKGVSTRYAWKMVIDGKPFVDYSYATLSKNQLREFDINFITLTALAWLSLFLFLLITRLGRTMASPKL